MPSSVAVLHFENVAEVVDTHVHNLAAGIIPAEPCITMSVAVWFVTQLEAMHVTQSAESLGEAVSAPAEPVGSGASDAGDVADDAGADIDVISPTADAGAQQATAAQSSLLWNTRKLLASAILAAAPLVLSVQLAIGPWQLSQAFTQDTEQCCGRNLCT